jgi:hypothetical protein
MSNQLSGVMYFPEKKWRLHSETDKAAAKPTGEAAHRQRESAKPTYKNANSTHS